MERLKEFIITALICLISTAVAYACSGRAIKVAHERALSKQGEGS
jgi:hypothetical protein